MLRAILELLQIKALKNGTSPEAVLARVLSEVIRNCPACGQLLKGHQYCLLATTTLRPGDLKSFQQLFSAIRNHDWKKVATFQDWEGNQANLEVYALKCPDGALTVIVISAPFALEEPYMLMHHEKVDDFATLAVSLDGDTWHQL